MKVDKAQNRNINPEEKNSRPSQNRPVPSFFLSSSSVGLDGKKEEENLPNLRLSHMCFLYSQSDEDLVSREEKEGLKADILKCVEKENMTPFYLDVCQRFGWPVDVNLVTAMKEKNEETIKAIAEKLEFSTKNEGDAEVGNHWSPSFPPCPALGISSFLLCSKRCWSI